MTATSIALPALPDANGAAPVFAAPWEAQVFALTVLLHRQGLFEWSEWTVRLAATAGSTEADPQTVRYEHWLSTLEAMLLERGHVAPLALTALKEAWREAAAATPHGEPVVLGAAVRRRFRADPV